LDHIRVIIIIIIKIIKINHKKYCL